MLYVYVAKYSRAVADLWVLAVCRHMECSGPVYQLLACCQPLLIYESQAVGITQYLFFVVIFIAAAITNRRMQWQPIMLRS